MGLDFSNQRGADFLDDQESTV